MRITNAGNRNSFGGKVALDTRSHIQCASHQINIHRHAAGVNHQIDLPLMLYPFRNRKSAQAALNFHLRYHVLTVVLFEQLPLVRIVVR